MLHSVNSKKKSTDGETVRPSETDVITPASDVFSWSMPWEIGKSERIDGYLFGEFIF
jgi:hypothetical protein